MVSYYVFIITSRTHPVYEKVQDMRRILLKERGIPYTILVNHRSPDDTIDCTTTSTTITPTMDDEILFPDDRMNPWMALKFLYAVRLFFRSGVLDEPTYIVRLNATTFVDFDRLGAFLETAPKEGVIMGPIVDWGDFVNGMIMIFSTDVLRSVLSDPRMFEKNMHIHNDDVFLSRIASPYVHTRIDLTPYFAPPPPDSTGIYTPSDNHWLYRIRSDNISTDRNTDLMNWNTLMAHHQKTTKKSIPLHHLIIVVIIILLIVLLALRTLT